MNLSTIAAEVQEHAAGMLTFRESDVSDREAFCRRMVREAAEPDVRFANLLLDVLTRIRRGDGIRPAWRG